MGNDSNDDDEDDEDDEDDDEDEADIADDVNAQIGRRRHHGGKRHGRKHHGRKHRGRGRHGHHRRGERGQCFEVINISSLYFLILDNTAIIMMLQLYLSYYVMLCPAATFRFE